MTSLWWCMLGWARTIPCRPSEKSYTHKNKDGTQAFPSVTVSKPTQTRRTPFWSSALNQEWRIFIACSVSQRCHQGKCLLSVQQILNCNPQLFFEIVKVNTLSFSSHRKSLRKSTERTPSRGWTRRKPSGPGGPESGCSSDSEACGSWAPPSSYFRGFLSPVAF